MIQMITVNVPEKDIVNIARERFVNEMVDLNSDHRTDRDMLEMFVESFVVCDIIWQDDSIDVVLGKLEEGE
jgi:hypothetical protein